MELIHVADDGGDEMTLVNYNGRKYPQFPGSMQTKPIEKLASVEIRSDDILVCTFPKSGTHWVCEMVRLLVAGKLDPEVGKGFHLIEGCSEDDYKNLPSPRILNTHVLYNDLPVQVKVMKPRIVYVTRNPKDVTVSYYNFVKKLTMCYNYTGEWKNFFRPSLEGKFDNGSWFDYVKDWEEVKKTTDVPILTINYEDMKENLFREMKKIQAFLGIKRSDEFVKEVCDQCSFASMKKSKAAMSAVTYRKGEIGDWKNWFTIAQNEWFDQIYKEKMKDCPLEFRYTLK
ncbi:sulfotransferase 1A1-like [Haliotis rufescens]|uniref:sulfotransferase 1A1-like n=1 Tax=Haliotis rufescens TaxID=6454 RepID=UPI00201F0A58|nr:sulfotransferase 1A1-like [Haliotis rufescens]XP_048252282.1 sulfotransferase 1A1-like [Haliotis rufescens]XP_048252283.1 sulfotransferase 1A1-like [Haliotis rufescens]XP_048252284.1 sulfotransferase 1A1-like [Haliotis rufescens]